jgi:hypothetical protein
VRLKNCRLPLASRSESESEWHAQCRADLAADFARLEIRRMDIRVRRIGGQGVLERVEVARSYILCGNRALCGLIRNPARRTIPPNT